MEIKDIKPLPVFYKQVETTLREINQYVGNIPYPFAEEDVKSGYKFIGPKIWNYNEADGNPDAKFTIDICFPIELTENTNGSDTKILEGFKTACNVLKGFGNKLSNKYAHLIDEMKKDGLQPSSNYREVYHLCDFNDQKNYITEIQLSF